MKVYFLDNANKKKQKDIINCVAQYIIDGGIVASCTDTVPGIIGSAMKRDVLHKIYSIKHRQISKPCSILVKDIEYIRKIAFLSDLESKIINNFFPGSVTLVLRIKEQFINSTFDAWSGSIGIRVPDNDFIIKLLNEVRSPVFATSLNQAGFSVTDCYKNLSILMKKNLGFYIKFNVLSKNSSSTVIAVKNNKIITIREGAIPVKKIQETVI